MSLSKEIEDSLQACREIEEMLSLSEEPEDEETVSGMDLEKIVETQETTEELETKEIPQEAEIPEETEIAEVTKKENPAKHSLLKTLLSIVICIFTALVLALIITQYVAHHTSVEGSSMETTLSNGDQIIVENVSYYIHDPERFDVVVFPNKEGVNYIKRIIGLPGETVQIADGYIFINGEALLENYGSELMEDPGLAAEEISLGEDEYFVLGDNRNASIDSRRDEVGTVKRDHIRGKAWFRFYPFSKAGSIK